MPAMVAYAADLLRNCGGSLLVGCSAATKAKLDRAKSLEMGRLRRTQSVPCPTGPALPPIAEGQNEQEATAAGAAEGGAAAAAAASGAAAGRRGSTEEPRLETRGSYVMEFEQPMRVLNGYILAWGNSPNNWWVCVRAGLVGEERAAGGVRAVLRALTRARCARLRACWPTPRAVCLAHARPPPLARRLPLHRGRPDLHALLHCVRARHSLAQPSSTAPRGGSGSAPLFSGLGPEGACAPAAAGEDGGADDIESAPMLARAASLPASGFAGPEEGEAGSGSGSGAAHGRARGGRWRGEGVVPVFVGGPEPLWHAAQAACDEGAAAKGGGWAMWAGRSSGGLQLSAERVAHVY